MNIIKLPYSRAPWRLVTSDGKEVYAPSAFDHPDLGMTVANEPICGDTKAECIERALSLLESMMRKRVV